MTRRRSIPPIRDGRRRAGVLAAAGLLALFGLAVVLFEGFDGAGVAAGSGPRIGGPFRLTAGDGRTVTDRSFPGRYLLIFFGYTSCPDECPLALASVADAMGLLGGAAAQVQPVFVTVDPAHDTPAVVRRYVAHFGQHLVGLTGSAAEIRRVAARYEVSVGRASDGRIAHSAVLFLMAPDGRLASAIPADASGAEIARDVRAALGEA